MSPIDVKIIGEKNEACRLLENNVCQAIAQLGFTARVTWISDPAEINLQGIVTTPALSIDGKVVSQGHLVSSRQVKSFLKRAIHPSHLEDFLNRPF